jgi:hypothetical protein
MRLVQPTAEERRAAARNRAEAPGGVKLACLCSSGSSRIRRMSDKFVRLVRRYGESRDREPEPLLELVEQAGLLPAGVLTGAQRD